jgi:hypothetical protein
MSEDFSNHFWTWYATDEYRLVLEVCELMKALDFLQAPASVQSSQIPYCPACETWSEMMLPVNDFLKKFPTDLSPSLQEALSTVWLLCNELPEDAFRCDDFQMFHAPDWAVLRSAASEALRWLEWESLQPQIDDVMLECHRALFPHSDRSEA